MKPHGLILHRNSPERLSGIVRSFTAGRKVACGSVNTKPRERQYAFRSRFLLRGTSMTNEHDIVSTDPIDRDRYTSSQTRERTLNAAIIQANISEGFEEYLNILDEFYADDIEVGSETGEQPIRGKARVRSLIANFLVPLHIMAEIGSLGAYCRRTVPHGDATDEPHCTR